MSIRTAHWSVSSRTAWVCTQTCLGVLHSGVFYSWGSLVQSINLDLNPDYNGSFTTNNGLFSGVFILFITTSFLLPVRLILDAKLISEFYFQMIGVILTMIGFIFGSISLRYKLVWLLYVGCVLPCGVGGLLLYQRLVFNHQFFFKSINRHNIGSGIIGFFIGMWTVIFFLLSVPLLNAVGVANVFLIYGAAIVVSMLFPLFSINDEENASAIAMAASFAYRPHDLEPDKQHESDKPNYTNSTETKDIEMTSVTDTAAPPLQEQDKSPSQTGLLSAISFSLNSMRQPSNNNADGAIIHSVLEKHPDFDRDVDMNGHYQLYYTEFPRMPQTYLLMTFFVCVITPGWGIKLASFSILETLFQLTPEQAADASALYVSFYAVGRLVSGMIAEYIGVFRTYDIMIFTSLALLVALPFAAETLPHNNGLHSSGYAAFISLLCIVGLMYGGAIALFYSIIFDVFGPANYRAGFVSTVLGFGIAVLAGGLSSAASFNAETGPNAVSSNSSSDDGQLRNANTWFYCMAGCCGLGLILLHVIERYPYDYSQLPPGYKRAAGKPNDVEDNGKLEPASDGEPIPDRDKMMNKAT